jgi:hypothetical protein
VATASSSNTWSTEVATHEFGHSFGELGDEYFAPGSFWPGGEPAQPNVSAQVTTVRVVS